MNDGSEGVQVQGDVQATAMPIFGATLSMGRTENKHAECNRGGINAVLKAHNDEGWELVGQPTFIGDHVDMWFSRTVPDDPATASTEPAETAEENPAASSEASPA